MLINSLSNSGGNEYNESNKLDDSTINKLESALPSKAKELLTWLKTERKISYWDRRKHWYTANVPAFTQHFNDSSCIWLTPDHADVMDSFVHELGQIYLDVLGFVDARPAPSENQKIAEQNFEIANYATNAFRMAIVEKKLEEYGIDRSMYRKRGHRGFINMLNKLPSVHDVQYEALKQPLIRAKLCYRYVSIRLILQKEFGELEKMWEEKIKFPEIRVQAKEIHSEALRGYLTPERYKTLQKYFLKVLNLKDRAII